MELIIFVGHLNLNYFVHVVILENFIYHLMVFNGLLELLHHLELSNQLFGVQNLEYFVQMSWVAANRNAPVWMHIVLNIGVVIMSITIAYGVMKIYDEPVREWLKDHWLGRKKVKSIN